MLAQYSILEIRVPYSHFVVKKTRTHKNDYAVLIHYINANIYE